MAESGHVTNLNNLKAGRDFATGWGAKYQPSNTDISILELDNLCTAAEAMLDNVQTNHTPYRNATAAAADGFATLRNLIVRVQKAAKAAGCPQSFLDDLDTPARKIKGLRAKKKKTDDPNTPVDEAESNNSASQMSRQQRIEHLDEVISLLQSQPLYDPNETELTVTELTDLSADLQTLVDTVGTTFVPYSNSLAARDGILYENKNNVVLAGGLFKTYVEAAFGRKSTEWNQVKGLKFTNQSRIN